MNDIDLTDVNNLITKSNNTLKLINDDYEYKYIVLDNDLKCLFIKTNDSNMSSAILNVNTGYINDPVDYPGLSHFLEHMLFMGSHKYPNENIFYEEISKSSGFTNAYTSMDHTCYYFEAPTVNYEKILNIFAHFFVDPLLKPDAVKRELNAIDSEHKKNLNSDSWRIREVIKNMFNENNPFKKFGTGNTQVLLKDNTFDKLVDALNDHYHKYYNANNMTLIIINKNIGNDFVKIINNTFGKIKNNKTFVDNNIYDYNIITKPNSCLHIDIVPLSETNELSLYWVLDNYGTNTPIIIIDFIFNYKGPGGLYDVLIEKNYLHDMGTGIVMNMDKKDLYCVQLTLSSEGCKYKDEIVSLVYEYINFMKTVNINNLFTNMTLNKRLSFIDKMKSDGVSYGLELIDILSSYKIPLNKIMIFPLLFGSYENIYDNYKSTLNDMDISKSCIVWCSISLDPNKMKHTEKYYKTKYNIYFDDYEKYGTTNQINVAENKIITITRMKKSLNHKYSLFNIGIDNSYLVNKITLPTKIINNDNYIHHTINENNNNWFIIDNIYGDNMTTIMIVINFKQYSGMGYIASCVYKNILMTIFRHELYNFTINNYTINIIIEDNQWVLMIKGINVKEVTKKLLDIIFSYKTGLKINDKLFDLEKESYRLELADDKYDMPYVKLEDFVSSKLLPNYPDTDEQLAMLENITNKNLITIMRENFACGNVIGIIAGNKQDTESINSMVNDKLEYKCETIYNSISSKSDYIVVKNDNPNDLNSAIYYMVFLDIIRMGLPGWEYNYILELILTKYIHQKFFNQLRTIDALGYVVAAKLITIGDNPKCNYKYLTFVVQSSIRHVDELKNEIDKFITTISPVLQMISVDEFEQFKTGVKNGFDKNDKNTIEKLTSLLSIIMTSNNEILINKNKILSDAINKISRDDFVKYYNKRFNKRDRKVIICGIDAVKNEND